MQCTPPSPQFFPPVHQPQFRPMQKAKKKIFIARDMEAYRPSLTFPSPLLLGNCKWWKKKELYCARCCCSSCSSKTNISFLFYKDTQLGFFLSQILHLTYDLVNVRSFNLSKIHCFNLRLGNQMKFFILVLKMRFFTKSTFAKSKFDCTTKKPPPVL